jgi:hypothetical protein
VEGGRRDDLDRADAHAVAGRELDHIVSRPTPHEAGQVGWRDRGCTGWHKRKRRKVEMVVVRV